MVAACTFAGAGVASANTPAGYPTNDSTLSVSYTLWHRSGSSTVFVTSATPLRGGDVVGTFNTYDQTLSFLGSHAGTFVISPKNGDVVFTYVSGWGMVFSLANGTGYATTPMGFHDGTLQAH